MEIVEVTEFSIDSFKAVCGFLDVLSLGCTEGFNELLFRELLDSTSSHLFLAKEDGMIRGMLTVGIYYSPTGKKAWIEDVVVDETLQGKGIGKSLVLHAMEYVKEAGVRLLMLTSNPSRIAANGLYQSLGFERKETNVYKMQMGG